VYIGVGKEGRGCIGSPWSLKFLAKKVVFLVLSGKKNFTTFGPPLEKILKNPLVPPLEKHFTIVQVNGCINEILLHLR